MSRPSDLNTGKVALVFLVVVIAIGIHYGPLAGFLTFVASVVSILSYLSRQDRP